MSMIEKIICLNNIQLKRGADGWRGIIGEQFSIESAVRLALSIGEFLSRKYGSGTILVNHDARFMSKDVALQIVKKLVANGYSVAFGGLLPTPVASYVLKSGKFIGAILVTASHNPFYWNGIKVKIAPGIPPSIQDENFINDLYASNIEYKCHIENNEGSNKVILNTENLIQYYVDSSISALNPQQKSSIINKKFKVIVESLNGVASEMFEKLLKILGCEITLLGNTADPLFGGLCPDPMNLKSRERIVSLIKHGKFDLGFVTDGDGDRLCVIDELGNFVWPHDILAIQFEDLICSENLKGGVAITGPTGSIIKRICQRFSEQCFEVPVGFKHISPLLQRGQAIIAGGAVGEIAYKKYTYDRDPLAGVVKLLNIYAKHNCSFSNIIDELHIRYGRSEYRQWTIDYAFSGMEELKALGLALINQMGYVITDNINHDGCKFVFNDIEWILLRKATTEGGVRIYAELKDKAELNKLFNFIFEITKCYPVEKA